MPYVDASGVSCGKSDCKSIEYDTLQCKNLQMINDFDLKSLYFLNRGISIKTCKYYEPSDGYTSEW